MKKIDRIALILLVAFSACKNQDWDFPDYDYQTVYFAYQYPVRTITLGDDIFDTSLDNAHKCKIMATTGGVYDNEKNITIGIQVDNALCDGFVFQTTTQDIVPMPSNYYSLAANQIVIEKGELVGGVEVQLTDAFFADPLAIKNTYVIPLVMTQVENADSILTGNPFATNPNRCIASDWNVVPKDYVLYAIKYINPWDGIYLRRGKDVITGKNGNTSLSQVITRHQTYVESDELKTLTTQSMSDVELALIFKDANQQNLNCNLKLTFNAEGTCTITSNSAGFTVSGSGKFASKGEANSWGGKDRDAIYLSYEIDSDIMHVVTKDTLVLRDRGVGMETFTPALK